ncbi:MAG TPA: hypothetical protein VKN99_22950 [Polyangia bacterium]|nr:hypothetical protein [Polyangia bacterium]
MREREIETLSDHLARLLQQADQLLREWKAFSDGVQKTLAAQVGQLDTALGKAVEQATRSLGPRTAAQLERELGETIDLLRKDVQALRETARRAAAELEGRRGRRVASDWRSHLPVLAVVLALLANALLVVLLLRAPVAPASTAPAPTLMLSSRPDAAPVIPAFAPTPPPVAHPDAADAAAAAAAATAAPPAQEPARARSKRARPTN